MIRGHESDEQGWMGSKEGKEREEKWWMGWLHGCEAVNWRIDDR